MDPQQLQRKLPNAALAFRGYNLTNLGRSRELLLHPRYGPIVSDYLVRAAKVCGTISGKQVDLVERVRANEETTVESYDEAISMILAVEMAQLECLQVCFGIDARDARVSMGYSLGEIGALIAGGVVELEDALAVPLAVAEDCVDLAADVTLGVLFTRGEPISTDLVSRICQEVNTQAQGVIGVSAYLSPNSLLLLGQTDTLDRFDKLMKQRSDTPTHLRQKRGDWPPMHTSIVWQRHVPNRSSMIMQTMHANLETPRPPVLSLVTGKVSYADVNAREILSLWIDHPQRLWDAVYEVLASGIDTVVHVGPAPNIIPATLNRLRDNVEAQTKGSVGMRALSAVVRRPWLKALLPQRTALLRATVIEQVVLEDWLLAHEPTA